MKNVCSLIRTFGAVHTGAAIKRPLLSHSRFIRIIFPEINLSVTALSFRSIEDVHGDVRKVNLMLDANRCFRIDKFLSSLT